MRTTQKTDAALPGKEQQSADLAEQTRLFHLKLDVLIQHQVALELTALGGSDPQARLGRRRRGPTQV